MNESFQKKKKIMNKNQKKNNITEKNFKIFDAMLKKNTAFCKKSMDIFKFLFVYNVFSYIDISFIIFSKPIQYWDFLDLFSYTSAFLAAYLSYQFLSWTEKNPNDKNLDVYFLLLELLLVFQVIFNLWFLFHLIGKIQLPQTKKK